MIGFGCSRPAIALLSLWIKRKGRTPTSRWWLWADHRPTAAAVFGNTFGWIFTETGRQPWLVFGEMPTRTGVSRRSRPGVSSPRWSSSPCSTRP